MIRHVRACAVALAAIVAALPAARADENVAVDQGWSNKQKAAWYTLSQGSRLIPLAWMQALEQPGSDKPFLDRDYVASFRYLPHDSPGPGRLPVGFAIDTQPDNNLVFSNLRWKAGQSPREAWVGMNCAACHTNEITYRGKRMRIEGAPTLADFQGFMEAFNKALRETRDDPQKWDRFAKIVLKGADNPANRIMLKNAFAKLTAWEDKIEKANATPLRYGYARLDAFGHIFNKVALLANPNVPPGNPADAPVSYPFLWNIPQMDKVQWNGIAKNLRISTAAKALDIGALGRNSGEVVGVFGDVKVERRAAMGPPGIPTKGFKSSINVGNLERLEGLLGSLLPPKWPADLFGPIDEAKRAAGEALFVTKGCDTCHRPLARDDLKTRVEVTMTALKGPSAAGTDPWMACNAYTYEAEPGVLRGYFKKYILGLPLYGERRAALADMLSTTVLGSLYAHKDELKKQIKEDIAQIVFGQNADIAKPQNVPIELRLPELIRPQRDETREGRFKRCMTESSPILAYKGRPLTGIWATPPYLHAGSVPTLYDVLLPADQRPKSFFVGSREFDPEKVGYVTAQSAENTFEFRSHDGNGRMIDGNSNAGHDYNNAALSEEDRQALVEYMKSL
jgi:hypothetical protein